MDIQKVVAQNAQIYDLLIGIFSTLPDEAFLQKVQGEQVTAVLDMHDGLTPGMSKAAKAIRSYYKSIRKMATEKVVEDLAVDRTLILRNPYENDYKPPYESQYRRDLSANEIILELQNLYTGAGLAQTENKESNDFLLIELDFVKQMLKKAAEPAGQGRYLPVAQSFLSDHILQWVPTFCTAAGNVCKTDFYAGWLMFLSEFVTLSRDVLQINR